MNYFAKALVLLLIVFLIPKNEATLMKKQLESVKWNEQLSDLHTMAWHLPKISYPTNYNLLFNLTNFNDEDNFYGTNSIKITFLEDSEELWLHGKDLIIQEINIKNEEVPIEDIEAIHYDQKEDVLIIKVLKKDSNYLKFKKDHHYIVEISFEGNLKIDGFGFLKVASHDDSKNEKKNVLVSFFAPNGAKWTFPCYDEPEYQPSLELTILHRPNHIVAGNSAIKEKTPSLSDHILVTDFEKIDKIQTHSIGLALMADYKKISYPEFNIKGKIPQRVFVPKDFKDFNLVNTTLLEFAQSMEILEKDLGIPISMEKIDHVFLNDYIPARIESPNLIISMIKPYTGLQTITFSKNELTFKSAAYQLFGIRVGPKCWSESWLSKGISNFLALKIADSINPEIQTSNGFNLLHCSNIGNRKYKNSITQSLDTPSEILYIYNPDIEIMGTCFMMMVESFLSSNILNKALLEYYMIENQDKYFNSLEENKFFEMIQKVVDSSDLNRGKPVMEALQSWTSKKQYPFINITVNYENQTLDIEQQNIYTWEPMKEWWIPLRFATIDEVSEELFLMPPVEKISIGFSSLKMKMAKDKCLYVNMKDRTLYSILYDIDNLKCLSSALQNNHEAIDPQSRAAIARNAFEKFWYPDNEMFSVYKDLLKFLHHEKDLYVWITVFYSFGDGLSNYRFKKADPFIKEYISLFYSKTNIDNFSIDVVPFKRKSLQKVLETISLILGYRFEIPESLKKIKEVVLEVARDGGDPGILNIMTFNCRAFENLCNTEFQTIKNFIIEKGEKNVEIYLKGIQECTKKESQLKELLDLLRKYENSKQDNNDQ